MRYTITTVSLFLLGACASSPGTGSAGGGVPVGGQDAVVSCQLPSDCAAPLTCKNGVCVVDNTNGNKGSCTDSCTAGGASSCTSGNGFLICIKGANGCLAPSEAPCPAGTKCTGNGICQAIGPNCSDKCTANATACTPQGLIQTCTMGADGCLALGTPAPCATGQICSGTSCVKSCTDECTKGTGQCSAQGFQACATGPDGCNHWQPPQFCPSGQVCANGACGPCTASSQCDAVSICPANGACVNASGHSYVFTFTSASVPLTDSTGSSWDAFGGAPDPYAAVAVNGVKVVQTTAKPDTFTPIWGESITVTLSVGDKVEVQLWDQDSMSDDFIESLKLTDWLSTVKADATNTGALCPGCKSTLIWSIAPK